MKMKKRFSQTTMRAIFSIALLATGCANREYSTPEEAINNACSALGPRAVSGALIGGLAGAAGGAAIGAAAGNGRGAAIGAGVGLLVGLAVGMATGNHLDQQDCQQAQIALQEIGNQPINQEIAWTNPSTGSHGTYTATSLEYTTNDHICRQIRADYIINKHDAVYGDTGVVCRSANGDWARVAATN